MTDYNLWKEFGELLNRHGYDLEDLHMGAKRMGLSTSKDRVLISAVVKRRQ